MRALMQSFAAVDTSRVSYHETKSISILDSVLEQWGFLTYVAPATVVREIRVPVVETYAIVGDTLIVTREGEEERTDLDSVSPLAGIHRIVSGDTVGRCRTP